MSVRWRLMKATRAPVTALLLSGAGSAWAADAPVAVHLTYAAGAGCPGRKRFEQLLAERTAELVVDAGAPPSCT